MSSKKATKKKQDKNPLLKDFGARLKKLREKRGLSGIELGKMVRMSRQAISRLEVGNANPSLIIINKFCKALNVKLETFFKGFK